MPAALCEMEGYWCYWHGGKGYSGVALHVSKALAPERPTFSHPAFDFEHRIVAVDLRRRSPSRRSTCRTAARTSRPRCASSRRSTGTLRRSQSAGRPLVLCGDLNVARTDRDVHPKERKPRAIGQLPEERALLEAILAHGLVDVGRALDPDNDGLFTWWAPWRNMRQRNIGWRLDYVLASTAVAERATSCPVQADIGTSDHAPVLATFNP